MTFDSRKATTLVMLALFAAGCLLALDLPAKARFMPLLVGIPGLLLCLVQLGLDLRDDVTGATAERAAKAKAKAAETEGEGASELAMIVWLIVFTAAIIGFGFLAGGSVMVLLFVRFAMRDSWQNALFAGAGTFATLYGVFVWLLELRLFGGLLIRAIF